MAGALDPVLPNDQSQDTSKFSTPALLDSNSSPDRHLPGGEKGGQYDKQLLDDLVDEILNVKKMDNVGSGSPQLETKKRKRELEGSVEWLRGVALNPVDPAYVSREHEQEILKMRRDMYLKVDDVANVEDLPSFSALRKKKKAKQFSDEQYKGKRRSERIARNFKIPAAHLARLRKRIGIGDIFQADVPDWSGPPSDEDRSSYRNDSDTAKWLGTHLWPQEAVTTPTKRQKHLLRHVNDKPAPNYCRCISPGSVACVRFHVSVARRQMKSELGQAFCDLGFELMGEEVDKVFTHGEQMLFNSLEKGITPLSVPKGFWGTASKHLRTKERKHLVRYFFNVYLLRRIGNQSRVGPASAIDSDEEDMDEEDDGAPVCNDGQHSGSVIVQASCSVSSSNRAQTSRKTSP